MLALVLAAQLIAGGEIRGRAESWSGFGAGAPAGADLNDAFALSRVLLRGELRSRPASLVVQLKSSLASHRTLPGGRRASDEDRLDVQQLFGEVRGTVAGARIAVRAGRFDLALGRERLVSPLDWSNARRTFQGAGLRAAARGLEAQLFAVRPVVMRRREANGPDSARALLGLGLRRARPALVAEAWWLHHAARSAGFNGSSGAERRHTLGARLARPPAAGRADAELEVAAQRGSVGAAPVRAWMIAAVAGWSAAGRMAPRVYAGVDGASGDDAPAGRVGTFNQLYPLGHAYLGYADVHGRQNVVAGMIGASLRPAWGVSVQVDAHTFHRASRTDALYGVDGSVQRLAGAGLPGHVGDEIDLTLKRAFGRVALQAGASRYVAGAFLRASGPSRDISWFYVQTTATF